MNSHNDYSALANLVYCVGIRGMQWTSPGFIRRWQTHFSFSLGKGKLFIQRKKNLDYYLPILTFYFTKHTHTHAPVVRGEKKGKTFSDCRNFLISVQSILNCQSTSSVDLQKSSQNLSSHSSLLLIFFIKGGNWKSWTAVQSRQSNPSNNFTTSITTQFLLLKFFSSSKVCFPHFFESSFSNSSILEHLFFLKQRFIF